MIDNLFAAKYCNYFDDNSFERTVERRMNEFGVRIGECYSNIADNLINLWFPSICHNDNGLGTWYLRLRTGRRDRVRNKVP